MMDVGETRMYMSEPIRCALLQYFHGTPPSLQFNLILFIY